MPSQALEQANRIERQINANQLRTKQQKDPLKTKPQKAPLTTKQQKKAHNVGESDCYTSIVTRHQVGPAARYTKEGTDAILNRILHPRGLPTRPDKHPKWKWVKDLDRGGDGGTDARGPSDEKQPEKARIDEEIMTGRPKQNRRKRPSTEGTAQEFTLQTSQAWDRFQTATKQLTAQTPDLLSAWWQGITTKGLTALKMTPIKAYARPVVL
ncbi:MAG: Pyruvate decarboxylase 1 [Watsoniomyces obsoletus]|nr:MAG: Pyruvate decarboxylase 1 [Watsoniomyces obsoletus]